MNHIYIYPDIFDGRFNDNHRSDHSSLRFGMLPTNSTCSSESFSIENHNKPFHSNCFARANADEFFHVHIQNIIDTVDAQNPAPPDMYGTL